MLDTTPVTTEITRLLRACAPINPEEDHHVFEFDQGGAARGNAIAASTILVALMEALVNKGVISNAEVQALLGRADDALKPNVTITSVNDARKVIETLVKRFDR
jgi:hypothetical protein